MKKRWIILLAAVLALAAVLLAVFCIIRGRKQASADSESLYPYSYTETSKGLLVTVKGSFPEGSSWEAVTENESVATVTEKKQSRRSAEFLIQPVSCGETSVTLSLMKPEDGFLQREFEISVLAYVSGDLKLSVSENTHKQTEEILEGSGTDFRYRIDVQDSLVTITVLGGSDWTVECEDAQVRLMSSEQTEDCFTAAFFCAAQTAGAVRVVSPEKMELVRLELEADRLGKHTLLSHEVQGWGGSMEPDKNMEAFISEFGALPKVPAAVDTAGTALWTSVTDEEIYPVGYVVFTLADVEWTLYLGDQVPPEAFTDKAELTWQNISGRTFYLSGEQATAAQVSAMAQKVKRGMGYE